ncbi:hypothetical protein CGCS363_v010690 [Colletotrichum siamense]|uniref:uncharacterized protein n=1 Tax=Colletotrichum siamense TaxID=690259 RepID=UPI001872A741|nr:uncharacterized protein CGCS363_v010690 [Colletotrichum siamense]KAF5492077.1 hypothetical protein CGCS363_v010690 [Colletotrichum siamense]
MAQRREEDFSPYHHSRTLSDDLGPPLPSIVIEPNPSLDAIRGNPVLETISRQHQSAASEQTSVGRRNRANEEAPGPICPGPGSSHADLALEALLRRHFQKHPQPEVTEGYLPAGYLENIVCFETVRQELDNEFEDDNPDDLDRLAHDICNQDKNRPSYGKVFALLCLIDKVRSIGRFVKPVTGVCDEDLPLQRVNSDENGNIDLRKRNALDVPLKCFLKWNHNALKSFDDWQWTLSVPILSRVSGTEAQYRKFDDRVILPLMSECSPHENGGVGGYSEVFKIQIHPRHHDFDQTDPEVA